MPDRPTIQTIAELAGVTKGTVSKVLNDRPGIGPETRRKVMAVVEKHQFHPSSVARALSFKKTSNIGLIIPHEAGHSLNSFYWSSLLTEMAQQAALNDYNLLLYTVRKEGELKDLYGNILQGKKVDGLIIGSELIDRDRMELLSRSSIPFILIGQHPEIDHHFIDIDNGHASRIMTEYMMAKGLKTIAFLSGPVEYYYNRERLNAYLRTIEKAGLTPNAAVADPYDPASVERALEQIGTAEPALDSLFIGGGCDLLYPVLDWRKNRTLPGPAPVITVFDDFKSLDYMEPEISAVRQPLSDMAGEGIRSLIRIIEGEESPRIHKVFFTTIKERLSPGETKETEP